jgi:hypothetical protein
MLSHQSEHAINERIVAKIAQFPQRNFASEMRFAIRVAARARKRALARNLDGKHRNISGKNSAPRGK